MSLFDSLKRGLAKSREALNEVFYFGGEVDEDFWEELEDRLVMADMGAQISMDVTDDLRELAAQQNFTRAPQIQGALVERLASEFIPLTEDPFAQDKACVLFVGINGAGKTTTVGKLAGRAHDQGKSCVIAAADTFRAAAIEQLEVWAERAQIPIVTRPRGADPASVCYEALDRADAENASLVLIDTAGRLHTSQDLMRELAKVVSVTRKRAEGRDSGDSADSAGGALGTRVSRKVYVVLVIDATTGQNGLNQAKEFNQALELDGLILTKLDGTAKGGIALAISRELKLPILRIGVGESIDDLQDFDATSFCKALVGEEV